MSKIITEKQNLTELANKIRNKMGLTGLMSFEDMDATLDNLSSSVVGVEFPHVLFPELPKDHMESHPYATILWDSSKKNYLLVLNASPMYYNSSNNALGCGTHTSTTYKYNYSGILSDGWVYSGVVGSASEYDISVKYTTIWTSYDIAKDSITSSEIWYKGTRLPSESKQYAVNGANLCEIATAIQNKAKTEDSIEVGAMAGMINALEAGIFGIPVYGYITPAEDQTSTIIDTGISTSVGSFYDKGFLFVLWKHSTETVNGSYIFLYRDKGHCYTYGIRPSGDVYYSHTSSTMTASLTSSGTHVFTVKGKTTANATYGLVAGITYGWCVIDTKGVLG